MPLRTDTPVSTDSQTRSSAVFKTIIQPGGTYGISQYGGRYYFQTLTGLVYASTDKTIERPYIQRQGEQYEPSHYFNRVEIRNPNAFPVFVQVWVGFGQFLDSTFNIIESSTAAVAQAATSIAAGATVTLSGTPTGNQLQRKSLVVSNPDSALDLQILDEANNLVATVFFRTSCTLPISGIVKVKNPNGSSVTAAISEIWYVQANL